jgi:hypothetical protein
MREVLIQHRSADIAGGDSGVGCADTWQDRRGGSGHETGASWVQAPGLAVGIVLGVGLWSFLLAISYWLGGPAGVVLCVIGVVSLTTAVLGRTLWRETRVAATGTAPVSRARRYSTELTVGMRQPV